MEKVKALLKTRTLEELVKDFEATENITDSNIYQVRGWLMDEIELRNPKGFDEWIESFTALDSELGSFVL